MILVVPALLPQVHGFFFIVSCIQFFDFHLDFSLYLSLCRLHFLFKQAHCKIEEKVRHSKPLVAKPKQSKLAVVKNNSSKPKRRSHKIAPKLEFSNTQYDPIEIEEAKEEVSVQREEIVFTEDGSKKQDSSTTFEGCHSSNDLLEYEDDLFQLIRAPLGKLFWPFYLLFIR